jgi:hypothetical protein
MADRGAAQRDKLHGHDYYETLQLKVYDQEQANNMGLKYFAVNHVRHWEAAVFVDLMPDLPRAIADL